MLTEFLMLDLPGIAKNIFVSYMCRFSVIKFIIFTAASSVRATIGTLLNNNDFSSASH